MEDLAGIAVENSDRMMYAGIGFGTGFIASYSKRYRDQRKGLDHDYSTEDFHRSLIHEDPITDLEDYKENDLMEAYYDNFEHVQQAYDDSKSSLIYTVAIDGMDLFLGENNMGLDEYPEGFAGVFLGLQIGRKAPTPVDIRETYANIRERFNRQ